ncbi:threonine synthase [Companilactobacillus jidongensis]|uniref:threonine synthase n=1 Tax=Companilactobacillus jidongensis TaxID=2486006 RepID=UPI000F7B101A|nr:threonine synthase [Companilactobacillus jidongensis]
MNNLYTSTRNDQVKISAKDAIRQGFSEDGGLYVFPNFDDVSINIEELKNKSYQDIAKLVLKQLLPDFSDKEIAECVSAAYDSSFDTDEITPVTDIDNFHILELFHGPTSAFKDVGLQLLPQLMKHSIADKRVMILTATSGDTGKAALEGFKNSDKIAITVFYPHNGVSKVQQLQMASTDGDNTEVAAIEGNFDDAQSNVKKILNDASLKRELGNNISLSSANSINIGRLIPQIVYYFFSYKKLVENNQIHNGDKVNFSVPTGNFGDVLAGYLAKQLGLPVNKFIVASNENNVLTDFFNSGIYNRNRPFFKTVAPSMDIQISSNFERLLYYKSNGNTAYVKQLMDELETSGKYQVSAELLKSIQEDFYCGYSTDDEIKESIQDVYQKQSYLMDPHTAVGYKVMRDYQKIDDSCPTILLSTASPYKFVKVVADAVLDDNHDDDLQLMKDIQSKTGVEIPKNLANVWNLPILHKDVIKKDEMRDYVKEKVEADLYDKN